MQFGHEVVLLNARYVKSFVVGNKTDFNDAQAIFDVVIRPNKRMVAIKTRAARYPVNSYPELLSTVEEFLPEHRERLYPPTETPSMFLAQAWNKDRSCQKAVNDAAINRIMGGLPPVSTTSGGYCRARLRLPLSMISELVYRTGELINRQIPEQWRWQGRRVYLIDGTTVGMPDTEKNQEKYPQQSGQKPSLGFPICRLVGIICLSSGAVLNAAIGRFKGKGADE